MPDIPVYVIQKEHSNKKPRTLHWNMLLPFSDLPNPEYVKNQNRSPHQLQKRLAIDTLVAQVAALKTEAIMNRQQ